MHGRRDEAFSQFQPVHLQRRLRFELRDLGRNTLHQCVQALALGRAAAILGTDLSFDEFALESQRVQDGIVDIFPAGRNLLGRNGEQRLSLLDFFPFSNVQLLHETSLRDEDFCCPRAWDEIAGNRLLTRVLRKTHKRQDEHNRHHGQPGENFGRGRLQKRHVPPLLVLELNIESLSPEQGTPRHALPPPAKIFGPACRGPRLEQSR